MRKLLEKDIQKAIADYLRYKGYVVVKFSSVGIYKRETDSYIPQAQKGVSDLLCCSPQGKFIAIEVKRPGNKPSPEQLIFIESINEAGGLAFIATSIDDVIIKLKGGE